MDKNFFISTKSAVNFCEPDSFVLGCVGEPWNVLSSIVIVFFGLYGLYNVNYRFVRPDNQLVGSHKLQSNILYSLLACIGIGSVFFHSHLSPFAHWVDIIFISIMLVYSQYILSPKRYNLVNKLKFVLWMLTHLVSSIFIPQIHIFLLFGTGFCVQNLIEDKIWLNYLPQHIINQRMSTDLTYTNASFLIRHDVPPDNKVVNEYILITKYFSIALLFWLIDYFLCGIITPYHVHWIFHIFIGFVSYKIIGLIKYL